MDTRSLMQLYQKLIQGQSNTSALICTRKLSAIKKNYTSSQLAKLRFSDEYLELIDNEKIFNQTIEALKYFYTSENNVKPPQLGSSSKFHNFLFEHLFSHSQKALLEEIVQAQFSGKKSNSQGKKTNEKRKDEKIQKLGFTMGQEEKESQNKHVFFELLESIIWDGQGLIQKQLKKEKKEKKKVKIEDNSNELSISQMMSMLM